MAKVKTYLICISFYFYISYLTSTNQNTLCIPQEEEIQLSLRQKLYANKGDSDGKQNPHGTKEWKYIYDFHKEPKEFGKKY